MKTLWLLSFALFWLSQALLPQTSWADPSLAKSEYIKAYKNSNPYPDYFPDWCSNNSRSLLKRFLDAGLDLSNSYALFVFVRTGNIQEDSIFPARPRNWTNGWTFHAVIEHEGFIYDLDFDNPATQHTTSDYFQIMFPESGDQNQNLLLKVIPAQEYFDVFFEYASKPQRIVMEETDSIWLPISLKEYLK